MQTDEESDDTETFLLLQCNYNVICSIKLTGNVRFIEEECKHIKNSISMNASFMA